MLASLCWTRLGGKSMGAISGCCPHRATERFLLVLPLTLLKHIVVRGGSIWPAKAGHILPKREKIRECALKHAIVALTFSCNVKNEQLPGRVTGFGSTHMVKNPP